MTAPIIQQRMTATVDGEFCLFLIGMRINRPLKVHKWLPVAMAMPRMLHELEAHKELGLLAGHLWFGRTTISLQYWRSINHLTGTPPIRISSIFQPGPPLRAQLETVGMWASGTKPTP